MKPAPTAWNKGLVLAVHPTSRGFGWVLFEGPLAPVDWGMSAAKKGRDGRLLNRFARLLDRYEPAVLVLEEFEGRVQRAAHIQQLCRFIIHLASSRGMDTPVFSRAAVQGCFATLGASNRFEIAQVIAEHIDAFSHRMPKPRSGGDGEDRRQALFDAAALALTYFAVNSGPR
jgi:hypothetical protein